MVARKFQTSLNGGPWKTISGDTPYNMANLFATDALRVRPLGDEASIAGEGVLASWIEVDSTGAPALMTLDAANDRGWFNGTAYSTEAAFLAAIGGSKSGITRTIGPNVYGTNLVTEGAFSGANDYLAWTAVNGVLSSPSGELIHTNNTGGSASLVATRPVTFEAGETYEVKVKTIGTSTRIISLADDTNTVQMLLGQPTVAGTYTYYVTPVAACTRLRLQTVSVGSTGARNFDDISIRKCIPFSGWNALGDSVVVEAVTPASVPSDVVLWQIGGPDGNGRLRVVYMTDGHLWLVMSRQINNLEASDRFTVDLGAIAASTLFKLEVAFENGAWRYSFNGALGTNGSISTNLVPGGAFYIGKDPAGSAWTGSITKISVFATAHPFPQQAWQSNRGGAIVGLGDSYIAGANGVQIIDKLRAGGRPAIGLGQGGDSAQNAAVRFAATSTYNGHILLFWDGRHNDWGDLASYMAATTQVVGQIRHSKFIVIPPVCTYNDTAAYCIETEQILEAMLAEYDTFHVVDWRPLLVTTLVSGHVAVDTSELDATDHTHLIGTAMDKMVTAILAKATANGW